MEGKGLTTREVEKMIEKGKVNYIENKSSKTVKQIVLSNLFTYFNAIFAFLSIILIVTGSFKSLTFLPVVIANTLIGIFQQLRAKKVLDELALLDISEYTVYRNGEEVRLRSDLLVLGDVIKLESGSQVPADAEVLEGMAGVNESLLTGEADEVEKVPGSELKSGSFLTSGNLVAKLTQVGEDSYAAKLTKKAKEVKERKSEMIKDIETIIKVASIIIIPIGIALFYEARYINEISLQKSITQMVSAVIGMIPEGLYLLVTVALALSAARLARKKVLLHDMRSIETLARVDVLCVDKTGTITTDVMEVYQTFGAHKETDEEISEARVLLSKYIMTLPDNNITMQALRDYFKEKATMDYIELRPFDSKKKYSEVVTNDYIYRLGAPEYLLDDRQLSLNSINIENYTNTGKRVIAFVREDRNGVVTPILFVALHNEIRENAKTTFNNFERQGVNIKVISGDNPVTVSRIAKAAGIANAEQYVDATMLDTKEKIMDAVTKYTVFGRVKPEQKKYLVQALKANGLKVAMTGDGVNDILAMKEADCSIAMGGGSDAARQAAQVVLLDSDFSHMNEIVFEGRRDINNITRSAILFLYKNIFSLLLAFFSIYNAFSYPLEPNQVSLISMFNVGVPAFLLALEANEKKQEGRFIRRTLIKSLPAALTSFFAIAALVMFSQLFELPAAEIGTASTYLLSVVGFLILWDIVRPLNKYRFMVLVICILGFIVGCNYFYHLFDITSISVKAASLCAVFAIAEISVMRNLTFLVEKINNYNGNLKEKIKNTIKRRK
ncbi:MAG: HAD-IC family P-type ATPase [Bacilli bacterium]|nr:HAD-IC family P-type ATPase [Bacilli bacterium]